MPIRLLHALTYLVYTTTYKITYYPHFTEKRIEINAQYINASRETSMNPFNLHNVH